MLLKNLGLLSLYLYNHVYSQDIAMNLGTHTEPSDSNKAISSTTESTLTTSVPETTQATAESASTISSSLPALVSSSIIYSVATISTTLLAGVKDSSSISSTSSTSSTSSITSIASNSNIIITSNTQLQPDESVSQPQPQPQSVLVFEPPTPETTRDIGSSSNIQLQDTTASITTTLFGTPESSDSKEVMTTQGVAGSTTTSFFSTSVQINSQLQPTDLSSAEPSFTNKVLTLLDVLKTPQTVTNDDIIPSTTENSLLNTPTNNPSELVTKLEASSIARPVETSSIDSSVLSDKNGSMNYTDKAWNSRRDFQVRALPGTKDDRLLDLELYSGQLKLDNKENYMYFMLAKNSTNVMNKDSWVIWLNGGPGCTSMYGAFLENGPFEFKSDDSIAMRDESWTKQVDVLYIDQPFGTGLSHNEGGDFVSSYAEMKDALVLFISKFLNLFPEYKHKKLILAGESDAGVSIPYLAHSILYPKSDDGQLQVDLKGLMIGDGWIDPQRIYASYLPFLESKLTINDKLRQILSKMTEECMIEYNGDKNPVRYTKCDLMLTEIKAGYGDVYEKCLNLYNYEMYDSESSCGADFPPQSKNLESYISRPEVQSVLNVRPGKQVAEWFKCSPFVMQHMDFEGNRASVLLMDEILKKIPVLLFAGDKDFAVNTLAHEYLISNLTWNGVKGFSNYQNSDNSWTVDGKVVGTYHTERNLSYSVIFNASHMVGYEKPQEMLILLSKFANFSSENLSFKRGSEFNRFGVLGSEASRESDTAVSFLLGFVLLSVIAFLALYAVSQTKYTSWVNSSVFAENLDPNSDDGYYQLNSVRAASMPAGPVGGAVGVVGQGRVSNDSLASQEFLGHYDYNRVYAFDSDDEQSYDKRIRKFYKA